MTAMGDSDRAWTKHTGLIDEELVSHAVGNLFQPIHYVVGPPLMVEAMRGLLARTGVASDDIRIEGFSGY